MPKRRRLQLLDNSQEALIVGPRHNMLVMEDTGSPIKLLITHPLILEVEQQYTALVEAQPSATTMLVLLTIAPMLLADHAVEQMQRVSMLLLTTGITLL
jgi:hypothetical protein